MPKIEQEESACKSGFIASNTAKINKIKSK